MRSTRGAADSPHLPVAAGIIAGRSHGQMHIIVLLGKSARRGLARDGAGRSEAVIDREGDETRVRQILSTSSHARVLWIASGEEATVDDQDRRPRPFARWRIDRPRERRAIAGNCVDFGSGLGSSSRSRGER